MTLAYDFDEHGHLVPPEAARGVRPVLKEVPKAKTPEVVPEATPASPPALGPQPSLFETIPAPAPLGGPLAPQPKPSDLKLDRTRDDLLTNFGKATLRDRYLLEGES